MSCTGFFDVYARRCERMSMCPELDRSSGQHKDLLTDTMKEEFRVLTHNAWDCSRALKMWNIFICHKLERAESPAPVQCTKGHRRPHERAS
jgi:hypothetical protein